MPLELQNCANLEDCPAPTLSQIHLAMHIDEPIKLIIMLKIYLLFFLKLYHFLIFITYYYLKFYCQQQ